MRTIIGVFARHGFQNVAERIKLGRFILERMSSTEDIDKFSMAERARMAFEQLGPTFIKFGQLLASRPDLVPEDFVEEFKKLHDQVAAVPFSEIHKELHDQFGTELDRIFAKIEEEPIAAASIAQVHRAMLTSGENVVVKIQRPGIEPIIKDDLNVLYMIADLLCRYIPESRPYNPAGIVNEFFKTLELETNFIVEANNIRRFRENFANDVNIVIPKIFMEYTRRHVLVMEALDGVPLSAPRALTQPGIEPDEVLRIILRCYMKMVFQDGLFHGDLHAGNLFIFPQNRVGLVDFGVVGRVNRKTQDAIASMLTALANEDYERLAFEYIDLAPFLERLDVDRFTTDVRDVIAPYYGLSLKNINLGKILLDSTAVAARHGLSLPTELMMFFKSVVTIESVARLISPEFDFLSYSLDYAQEVIRAKYVPGKAVHDITTIGRESASLIYFLPRQIRQSLRKLNSPQFSVKIRIAQIEDLKRSIETSSNIVFLGLIIGSLIMSASLILVFQNPHARTGLPLASGISYLAAVFLGVIAFYNYIKK